MAKLEGEEKNENSYVQDLQMLQDLLEDVEAAAKCETRKCKTFKCCKMLLEDGEVRRRRNKPELIDARPSTECCKILLEE